MLVLIFHMLGFVHHDKLFAPKLENVSNKFRIDNLIFLHYYFPHMWLANIGLANWTSPMNGTNFPND
jgi:hypothetical protein